MKPNFLQMTRLNKDGKELLMLPEDHDKLFSVVLLYNNLG
jgi:hypothetical protein